MILCFFVLVLRAQCKTTDNRRLSEPQSEAKVGRRTRALTKAACDATANHMHHLHHLVTSAPQRFGAAHN